MNPTLVLIIWAMGHHPQRAYGLASVSVTAAAWSAVGM
jgi:hypothetical protein